MAEKKEDTLNIDTYRMFFRILLFGVILCFFASLAAYMINQIKQDFFSAYLTYQTIYCFSSHFPIFVYFFLFCFYSLFFKKKYLYDVLHRRRVFHQIVGSGFNLIILSLFVYLFALEISLPFSKQQCSNIITKCRLADDLLVKAEALYSGSQDTVDEVLNAENKRDALRIYENYGRLVTPDRKVNDRIRELRSDLYRIEYSQRGQNKIPENLDTYEKLANYFFLKEDYFSAWFYYMSLEKGPEKQKRIARERIEEIKKKLRYQNSLYSSPDLGNSYMDLQTRRMQELYKKLEEGENLLKNRNYLDAYYLYCDIYNENSNIRDAKIGRDEAMSYLQKNAVAFEESESARSYAGKENFMLFCNDNVVMKVGVLRQFVNIDLLANQYFFYDTQLCYRDEKGGITKILYAPYGKVVHNRLLFLCYDKFNRENVYSPVIEKITEVEMNRILNNTSELAKKEILKFYKIENNVYELKEKKNFKELAKLSELTRRNKLLNSDFINEIAVEDMNSKLNYLPEDKKFDVLAFYYEEKGIYKLKENTNLQQLLTLTEENELWKNEMRSDILPFPYDMSVLYRFSYNNESAEDFSIFKLLDLREFYQGTGEFNTGLSHGFIGAAIARKISKIFIFFYICCILLRTFFRLRTSHYNSWYLILLPFVLVSIYALVMLITLFAAIFFNVLGSVLSLHIMFIATISIHIVISFIVICYTMSTEVVDV